MNITIKSKELDQLKDLPYVKKFLDYNSWNNTNKSLKVDVSTLTDTDMKKIVSVLKKDEVTNRCPLDVIEQWKKVKANPNDQRPRTLEQFATILKEYLAKVPKYYLFQQNEDEDFLAYVVTSIGYTPPKRERGGVRAGYVYARLNFYEHGKNESTTLYFHKKEIEGKTCAEIMDKSGFMIATDDMIKRYELELERYKKYRAAVGLQVLGTGEGHAIGETASWWGGKSLNTIELEVDGRKSRLVLDDQEEGEESRKDRGEKAEIPLLDGSFWKIKGVEKDTSDDDANEVDETTEIQLEVPLHPTILCFHLEKHVQLWAHVNRLEDYVYDTTLGEKLVLPSFQRELIEILVHKDRVEFKDIIKGKSGGSIVLCSGVPGTGKTLTAEVFAEAIQRPLYIIQSAQLGTSAEELEKELIKVLQRASRWGAILLVDEADVFIHTRGDDIEQNAIVGVFLRVLEYYNGILFLTTNRTTIIDDAIISRCTAQVKFQIPDVDGQKQIWKILADLGDIEIKQSEIDKFAKAHDQLSGRDVKGLLKLAQLVSRQRKEPITAKLLDYILQFKPVHMKDE
jgi:hypothetical protein